MRKRKTQTFSDGTATVTVTAELYAELEDLGEVEVEIEGYEDWIPRGNLENEVQPGNTVKVTAKVQARAFREKKPAALRTSPSS